MVPGDLRELLEDVLSPASLGRHGIFEPRFVSRLLREHATGRRDHRKRLLNLLMFQLWWNAFAGDRRRAAGERSVVTPGTPETAAARINRDYYESDSAGPQRLLALHGGAPGPASTTLLALVREEPVRSLVDLGCGGGMLLREIEASLPGSSLLGIDLSPRLVEENRRGSPAIRWEVADLEQPLGAAADLAGRWDVVVASEILEHLDEPAAFLRNASFSPRPAAAASSSRPRAAR